MKTTKSIPGIVHYQGHLKMIRSVGRRIDISYDNGDSFDVVGHLDLGIVRNAASLSRLGSRLTRANIKHCIPLDDDLFMIFAGHSIFHLNTRASQIECVAQIVGSRPLRICRFGNAFYYGEYRSNRERQPIHIWKSIDNGQSWNSVYEFSGIRHVHGVFCDPTDDSIWITTGDYGTESAIWHTKDDFKNVNAILQIGQQSRAIDLVFTDNHVFFGTDAPDEQNWIYKLDKCGTSDPVKIQQALGPVFHAAVLEKRLFFFSTAREPSRFNNSNELEVWCWDGKETHLITSYQKDFWSMKYFQYGQVLFPFVDPLSQHRGIWMTPFAANKDQTSQYFELEELFD